MFTWGSGKGLGNGGRQNTERSPKRVLGIINDLFLPFFHLTNFFFFYFKKGMEQLYICDLSAGNQFSCVLTRDGRVYRYTN